MAKSLKDILSGKKASKVTPGSTGSNPGVDYAPKAPNEQEFVKLHKVEKHEDRVGNGDDVYQATNIKHSLSKPEEKRHGYKKPEDEKVNEEAKCNMTEEGTHCPVHEMANCKSPKPLREIAKKKNTKEQTSPYEGGIDYSGAPRNTYPNYSVDNNTGRNV